MGLGSPFQRRPAPPLDLIGDRDDVGLTRPAPKRNAVEVLPEPENSDAPGAAPA